MPLQIKMNDSQCLSLKFIIKEKQAQQFLVVALAPMFLSDDSTYIDDS